MPPDVQYIDWFQTNLESSPQLLEIWIYGSVLKSTAYKDVDVFIKYHQDEAKKIPFLKRTIERKFAIAFAARLDLLFLSESECEEFSAFVDEVKKTGKKIF